MRKGFKTLDGIMDFATLGHKLKQEYDMKVQSLPSIRGPEDVDPSDFDTQEAWEAYETWLTHLQLESDESKLRALEERALLEENAIVGDRLRRQGWSDEGALVVSTRRDQYGRLYVECHHPTHGRSEIVLTHDMKFIRKANLGD